MKKLTIILMLALVTLTACHKDKEEEAAEAQRTVLIYMAAQNNLTYWPGSGYRFCESDLKEIRKGIASLGDNHLVVYVDQAQDPDSARNHPQPYLLHFRKGELRDSIAMDASRQACDPKTIQAVAQKAFADYPAQDYALVLWGHATGWLLRSDTLATSAARHRAYGGTNPSESNRGSGDTWMNIPTLAKALKSVNHLKYIFADCCNMMCAECAYELKDVCDYFIASPAEIPGLGAPYDQVIPAMMERETFYTSIIDKYAAAYNNQVPLATVKTSEMPQLAAATRTVLQTMGFEPGTFPNMSGQIYYLDRNLYDMNHFIKTYAPEAEYASWKQAFDRAVIYKKYAQRWDTMNYVNFGEFSMNEADFGGISMFVPKWTLQRTDNEYIKKFGWYYAAGYNTIGW